MDKIINSDEEWYIFARSNPSIITGKQYPEMYAWSFNQHIAKVIVNLSIIAKELVPIISF